MEKSLMCFTQHNISPPISGLTPSIE